MNATITIKGDGIGLVRFMQGKPKQTKGPVKKRKIPTVSVYKGRKVEIKRGFVLRVKNKKTGNYGFHLFQRNEKGYFRKMTPSVITLAENSGFSIDDRAQRERDQIVRRILKRLPWVFQKLTD